MGQIENIRTIAKTEEILEKLNKLDIALQETEKSKIPSARTSAYTVGGDGLNGATSSNSPPLPITGATNAAGGAVGAVTNNPATIPPGPGPNGSGITDSLKQITTKELIDFINKENAKNNSAGGGGGGGNTDQSTKGSVPPTGGSKANNQATSGAIDDATNIYRDALNALGIFSPEEVDKKIDELLKESSEPGVYTIGDVMKGNGPALYITPSDTSQTITSEYESLVAVVGLDVDNAAKAVMLRFDGNYPTPTLADQIADGWSTIWTNPNTPPVDPDFTQGVKWTDLGISQAFATPTAAARNIGNYYFNALADVATWKYLNLSYTAPLSVSVQYELTYNPPVNTVSIVDFPDRIVGTSCAIGVEDGCPVSAPTTQTSWPKTNTYVLVEKLGKYIGNLIDSEVPQKYKNVTSQVQMQDPQGNVTNITPAIGGGTLFYDNAGIKDGLYFDSNMAFRAIVPVQNTNFFKIKN